MAPVDGHVDDRSRQQDSPAEPPNAIPPRHHYRPSRSSSIPPQPTLKNHTIRLAVATAIGFVLMFALLMLAVRYAQRDWSRKNLRARAAAHPQAAAAEALQEETGPQGWKYELLPSATLRQMDRLEKDPFVPNWWLILGRGLADKTEPHLAISSLRMAMAAGGESAELKNDLGAVYLQQKRMKEAAVQFRAAEQIRPGFAPALFNRALCAVADRDPEQAIRLLGRYLGQRPDDPSALRLQASLLSQTGQHLAALLMLQKFLKNQPPDQPLFLEAAVLAARLNQNGNAIRYLETALNGNSLQTVARAYQSPVFREIRLSGEGEQLTTRIAEKARAAFSVPVAEEEIQPLRATTPEAKVR